MQDFEIMQCNFFFNFLKHQHLANIFIVTFLEIYFINLAKFFSYSSPPITTILILIHGKYIMYAAG